MRNLAGSSADQTITEISVEEQSTGELSIGVGYSSLDKSSILFGINERNFLGTGRRVDLSFDLAKTRTNITIGLTEPYLFGRNLTGNASVFNDKTKLNKTTTNRTGFDSGSAFRQQMITFTRSGMSYHSLRQLPRQQMPPLTPAKMAKTF